jgi:hypothetical protein
MTGSRIYSFVLLGIAALTFNSCLREDPLNIEDGLYIKGNSTAFNSFDENGMMIQAINEVNGQPREGLYEIYISVSSESDGFNIIEVNDNEQTKYGPTTEENIVLNGENGQITGTIQKGIYGPSEEKVFTVKENGLYHVIIDKLSSTYIISPVTVISLYGHFSGEDWTETDIPLYSSFDKSNLIFEYSGLELAEGEYRFRYGHGDKIQVLDNEVAVYTSFGGTISGTLPSFDLTMSPGGNDYIWENAYKGTYRVNVFWSVGMSFEAQMTETGSTDFPEKLFMIGNGISSLSGEDAWNWDLNDFEMIPIHSQPHLFWKIVWLNENGGLRFAPRKGSENDFGSEGDGTAGLYDIGEENLIVKESSGYYMVVVNLLSNQISVARPEVYLIGDVVESWDAQNPLAILSVQDAFDVLYMKKRLAAGNLRMYAWHNQGWFSYWWNTEFNVYEDGIKYAGKVQNLEPVGIIEGVYEIKINFKEGNGSIEYCDCS